MRTPFFQLLLAFSVATFSIAGHGQQSVTTTQKAVEKQKLVIQMSDADPAKWNLALNNARNVQDDLGAQNVDIEIVAYGPGIGMLKMDAPVNSRVTEARKAGVAVLACENTMRNQKLQKADMHPDVGYTPSGVTQIMRRQREGFAYLRP